MITISSKEIDTTTQVQVIRTENTLKQQQRKTSARKKQILVFPFLA
jgi:hypothetical protein